MIQKTFFVNNLGELLVTIPIIKKMKEYKSAKNVLVLIYGNGFSKREGQIYYDAIKAKLPNAAVACISVITSQRDWNRHGASVSFFLFKDTDVNVYTYDGKIFSEDDIIEQFERVMEDSENLKAVLTYPVGVERDFTRVLEGLSGKYPDVVFFGGLAAARDYRRGEEKAFYSPDDLKKGRLEIAGEGNLEHLLKGVGIKGEAEAFVIGDGLIESGCVLITLSGERLQTEARYVLGWKPLGIGLPVTGRVQSDDMGNACLTEIDGMPATEIYKKYLDVDTDEYFLDNVCEFPIIVERNGTLLARVPLYSGEEGKLYFSGDIRKGEDIRLSYVNPIELFRNSKRAADELAQFEPEAMLMTICYNRFHFLKEEQYKEIEYFLNIHENLIYGFGGYEILKGNDCGGILNSALIALCLREGEPKECSGELIVSVDEEEKKLKPLANRLLTFIDTSTEELEKAYAEAEAANMAKSAFLSNMSHEIRTPINAILGMNEMILRESEDDNIIEYANNINSASHSLLGIVNDILDFSKINAGKMEIIPVEYELASVLNDLVTMVEKRADDKGLRIRVNVNPSIPHLLYGDEIRLKQVVTNILTNAVKYTEKGGVVIVVDFEYSSEDTVDDNACAIYNLDGNIRCSANRNIILKFSIEDTGIGIKKEDLPRLFNSFERVDEKRNRTIEGTGLGMSITQNLLSLMGSKLEVESDYGVGSKFSFELEQKIVDFTPIGDYEASLKRSITSRKEYHESFVAPDAKILVVDDTEMNLTVIKNLLKKTKIQIDTALSGFECLDLVAKTKYDIIFLDHRMPEMDGIECLQKIKADSEGINISTPIIALTANAVSGSREMYLNAGFDNYITKPINPEALETMMSTLLPVSKVRAAKHVDEENQKLPDWIADIPFVSAEIGVKNCGDVSSFISALVTYAESFEANKKAIAEAKNNGDVSNYTIKVHALKSSSKIIGAMQIGLLAEKLEAAGNAFDVDTINVYTDELLSYYSSLCYMLKHHLDVPAKEDEEDKPLISAEGLEEAYGAIREIAEMFDYDSLMGVMESLKEYRLPEEEKDRFASLKKAVANADWDQINSIMKG